MRYECKVVCAVPVVVRVQHHALVVAARQLLALAAAQLGGAVARYEQLQPGRCNTTTSY